MTQPMYFPQQPQPTAPPKSPGVALILSLLIPGAGHLYTGDAALGVMWFVFAVIAWLTLFVFIGLLLVPAVAIGAAVHAYASAGAWNRRHHAIR